MKNLVVLVILVSTFIGCQQKDAYNPNHFFPKEQQADIIKQSVHFSAKLPPGANHTNKFNPEFDWYYDLAAKECDFRGCASETIDSAYFFLMTRKARSIWPAREAIGGKIKVDAKNKLIDYEEIFRTWKMTEDSLNTRAFELFDLMVKDKDLTPYRSKYKGDRFIEFPDDRFYFNKELKRWSDSLVDSLK